MIINTESSNPYCCISCPVPPLPPQRGPSSWTTAWWHYIDVHPAQHGVCPGGRCLSQCIWLSWSLNDGSHSCRGTPLNETTPTQHEKSASQHYYCLIISNIFLSLSLLLSLLSLLLSFLIIIIIILYSLPPLPLSPSLWLFCCCYILVCRELGCMQQLFSTLGLHYVAGQFFHGHGTQPICWWT